MNTQSSIAVLYLARYAEGIEPIRQFAHSYRTYKAGINHELVVIFKGYKSNDQMQLARAEFAGVAYIPIELSDIGFDLGSYFQAARKISHEYIVCLNTFSYILSDDWLKKLYVHASRPDVGIVGATGSYQSVHSWMMLLQKILFISKYRLLNNKKRKCILKYFYFIIHDELLKYPNFFEKCMRFIKKEKLVMRLMIFFVKRSQRIFSFLFQPIIDFFLTLPINSIHFIAKVNRFIKKEKLAKRCVIFFITRGWQMMSFLFNYIWQLTCFLFIAIWKVLCFLYRCMMLCLNSCLPLEKKYQKWWQRMKSVGDIANFCKFPEFPNYHIRTNAFMISRQRFLGLRRPVFREKIDTCFFESGKDSMTRQILAAGLKTKVVGCSGEGYDLENWFQSHTFRSGQQKNLLISDNQTNAFDKVSREERLVLELTTWGEEVIDLPDDFPHLGLRFKKLSNFNEMH